MCVRSLKASSVSRWKKFSPIDPEPIAAASLSQVYRRFADRPDRCGQGSAPGIVPALKLILSILKDLVGFVVNRTSYGDLYDFAGMMAQLERTLMNEPDFRKEGCQRRSFPA